MDPHQPSKADILEIKKAKKSKPLFTQLKNKLLNYNIPFRQTNNRLSPNEKDQPEIESVSCHICGNLCKEKDYFCAECGAKLKMGHYDDGE